MLFIETPTFTRLISALLDDGEYSRLQEELVKRPDAGDLIKDGGGYPQVSPEAGGHRKKRRDSGYLLLAH